MPRLRGTDRDPESESGFDPDVRADCSDRTGVFTDWVADPRRRPRRRLVRRMDIHCRSVGHHARCDRRRVIRFDAIGEAWQLFRQQIGVWVFAALIVTFCCGAVQYALLFLSIPMSIVAGAFLSGRVSPFMAIGSLAVSMAVWGVCLGGMYRMALKQIDGHSIGLV